MVKDFLLLHYFKSTITAHEHDTKMRFANTMHKLYDGMKLVLSREIHAMWRRNTEILNRQFASARRIYRLQLLVEK